MCAAVLSVPVVVIVAVAVADCCLCDNLSALQNVFWINTCWLSSVNQQGHSIMLIVVSMLAIILIPPFTIIFCVAVVRYWVAGLRRNGGKWQVASTKRRNGGSLFEIFPIFVHCWLWWFCCKVLIIEVD